MCHRDARGCVSGGFSTRPSHQDLHAAEPRCQYKLIGAGITGEGADAGVLHRALASFSSHDWSLCHVHILSGDGAVYYRCPLTASWQPVIVISCNLSAAPATAPSSLVPAAAAPTPNRP
jgi:hypothetical protein